MKSEKFEVKDILKRAKLLMEYDTRKTYDENIKTLNEDEPIVMKTMSDTEICNQLKAGGAQFLDDPSESLNVYLGCSGYPENWEAMSFEDAKTLGADELVDAFDYGLYGLETDVAKTIIAKLKNHYVKAVDRDGLYYPAIEVARMTYNMDEDGDETLGRETKNPPGNIYGNVTTRAKVEVVALRKQMVSLYDDWLVHAKKEAKCEGAKKDPDNKTPVVEPPKPSEEKWKQCCVFKSNIGSKAEYRPDTKDILVPVEYGYMLLTPGQGGWTVGGSLKVYDDNDNEYNQGRWTCGTGQFKFYITA